MSEMEPERVLGRYALYAELARGGMATVHLARLLGEAGFSRTVAVKRLHPHYARDRDFVDMFLDEARVAARIRHPNVVPVIDVVATDEELLLVMEFVQGEALSSLLKLSRGSPVDPGIAAKIACDMLYGLHAAHEAKNEHGEPLHIVHRDISPHNLMVGSDGVARVADFGIAKAANRMQVTQEGQLKGKLAYMSPEQFRIQPVDRRVDIYAAAIVLWEALTARRLFPKGDPSDTVGAILRGAQIPPSAHGHAVPPELDAVVMRALSVERDARFATAKEMAIAIERALRPASASDVGAWVETLAKDSIAARAKQLTELESKATHLDARAARDYAARLTDSSDAPPEKELPTATFAAVLSPGNTQLSGVHMPPTPASPGKSRGLPLALLALIGALLALLTAFAIFALRNRSHAAAPTAAAADAMTSDTPAAEPAVVFARPVLQPTPDAAPSSSVPTAAESEQPVDNPAVAATSTPKSAKKSASASTDSKAKPAPKPAAPKPAAAPAPVPAPPPPAPAGAGFGALTRE